MRRQVQSTKLVWIWKNAEISENSPYGGLLTGFLEFHPFESFSCNASVVTADIPLTLSMKTEKSGKLLLRKETGPA